eukprot:TRINITY_DN19405_c0_g1_i1.p4 TRINITY_DN19405_c0_g1~~TRINITY_DN19405_c0_g1_i1.p4  ORF type:complete len:117 (-),score=1.30 TRINITY_DN19405_c0_g1_i1:407-757(-)
MDTPKLTDSSKCYDTQCDKSCTNSSPFLNVLQKIFGVGFNYIMDCSCYCGLATRENQIKWILFAVFFVVGTCLMVQQTQSLEYEIGTPASNSNGISDRNANQCPSTNVATMYVGNV